MKSRIKTGTITHTHFCQTDIEFSVAPFVPMDPHFTVSCCEHTHLNTTSVYQNVTKEQAQHLLAHIISNFNRKFG